MHMPRIPLRLRARLFNALQYQPARAARLQYRLSQQAAGQGFQHSPLRQELWRALDLTDRARRGDLPRPVATALLLWWAEAGPIAHTLWAAYDRFGRPRVR